MLYLPGIMSLLITELCITTHSLKKKGKLEFEKKEFYTIVLIMNEIFDI